MSLDTDDEILQDFIVEAGEILELLSEQLVDLESKPDDSDLLNAIFRGFHTVKGGAGFLALNNLVNVCHVAENVFDLLRQGQRSVDAELMDVVLKTLDTVNDMFEQIKSGHNPDPAEDTLLQQLEVLADPSGSLSGGAAAEPTAVAPEPEPATPAPEPAAPAPEPAAPEPVAPESPTATAPVAPEGKTSEDITEDEFENLLDSLHGAPKRDPDKKSEKLDSDEITEDEFESLLNELSDDSNKKAASKPAEPATQAEPTPAAPAAPVVKAADDTIDDDEFEALLDKLASGDDAPDHLKPKEEATEAAAPPKEEPKPAAKAPEPEKAEPKPAPKPAVEAKPAAAKASDKVSADKQKESGVTSETTVRVDTSRLDEIMNMVGELVLVRNRLVKLKGDNSDDSMSKAVSNLDIVTADLQMAVMKTRMQPIKKVFGRFPRVVRDLARSLKKEVLLEMEGEETDLDKNLVEALSDPLVHLVRNSVDHGIESPDDREKIGKSRTGKIILAAEQAGDHILLSITDDGKGMDANVLRASVVEKGIMDEDAAARLDDNECFNLIFMPGFSTKKEISDISGRGVGMDVVKTKITQLNGTIDINSKKDQGSKISIKVPLTLAILPTLMVVVGGQTFALPLTSVNEIFNLDLSKTNMVDGQLVIIVRDKAVPLFYLQDWLSEDNSSYDKTGKGHVVIVSIGTQRVGFVVDGLVGQEEVVIKALGEMLQGTAGMAGATITGDGKIAMILDVPTLLERYA